MRRVWTEGLEPALDVQLGEPPGGDEVLAVIEALRLHPRPVLAHPPVRLEPAPMALLIGRHQPFGHGLDHATAQALQTAFASGTRHFSVRRSATDAAGGERRRNVEVVDGPGGVWRVRQLSDGRVELAPASTTAVLRAVVALALG